MGVGQEGIQSQSCRAYDLKHPYMHEHFTEGLRHRTEHWDWAILVRGDFLRKFQGVFRPEAILYLNSLEFWVCPEVYFKVEMN